MLAAAGEGANGAPCFVLCEAREFRWPVAVQVPAGVDDDGNPVREEQRFVAVFVEQPLEDVLRAIAPRRKGGDGEDAGEAGEADAPLLERVFVGWDDIRDEGGAEVPFSEESRAQLLGIPYVAGAVLTAYLDALSGRPEKN